MIFMLRRLSALAPPSSGLRLAWLCCCFEDAWRKNKRRWPALSDRPPQFVIGGGQVGYDAQFGRAVIGRGRL
jgi:hypothetical protein